MVHKRLRTLGIVAAVAAVAALGASTALAHGWRWSSANPEDFAKQQQTMFQHQADLLGVSVDEIKNAWAQGKTLADLAKEKNISTEELQKRMKEASKTQAAEQLKILVDRGVISQQQADQRLKVMQGRIDNGQGKGFHRGFHHGHGMGMFLGE